MNNEDKINGLIQKNHYMMEQYQILYKKYIDIKCEKFFLENKLKEISK